MAKQTPQFTPLPTYGPNKPSKSTSSLNMSVKPKPNANIYTSGPQQNFTPLPKPNNSNMPQMSILPGSNLPQMSVVPNQYNNSQPNNNNTNSNATIYTSGPQQNFTLAPGKTTNIQPTNNNVSRVSSGSIGSNSTTSSGSIGSNSTTSSGSTGSGTGSLATPTGAATIGSADFNYNKTPQQIAEEEALRRMQEYNNQQSQQDLNYNNIMQDTLRQFQGEIDATNQVYADKLRVAGIQGQNRLGQQRAENFNAGAVNSSFGNAAQDRTQSYNNDVEAGIQAQKLQSLAQIESSARELGNKYYEQKKAAKESGLAGYLENIKSAGAQKEAIATDIATNMLNAGLTVDEISPAKLEKIAKDAGVPLQQIKTTFKAMKDAMDAAAAEAALKGQFNLSEGQARYDAQGNLIASRAKTYKGGSGGGGAGSGSASAIFSSFPADIQSAAQSIIDGKSKLNEYPSAKRLQINAAMSKLYTAEGGNELAQGAYDAITALEGNKGFRSAIGSNRLLGFGKNIQGSASAGYLAELDRLKANLKLVNIKYLKGTGAISDAEGKTLEDASTSLSERLPEKQFKEELARVKKALLKASNISTGGNTSASTIVDSPDGPIEIID